MRLLELKIYKLSIPYVSNPPSDWTDSWGIQLYVKLIDGENYGWGETLVAGSGIISAYEGVLEDLISPIISSYPFSSPSELEELLEKLMFTAGNCGVVTGSISSVEMAYWDLISRSRKMSLCEILGGAFRERIRVYASFPRFRNVDAVSLAVERSLERGFDLVKLHQPPNTVIDSVKAIRDKFGYSFKLALDLNAPFDLKNAMEFISKVHRYEIEWVEEPIWPPNDYYSLERLSRISPIPIAAGENEYTIHGFRRLLDSGVLILQPDIAKIGGVSKFLRVLDLAKPYNIKVYPHDRPDSSPISLAFTLHVAATRSEIERVEYTISEFPSDLFTNLPKFEKGEVVLPKGYGIGLDLNEKDINRYRYERKLRILKFADLEYRMS